jgi:hypothetical protein
MIEIIVSVLINFSTLSLIFLTWRLIGSVRTSKTFTKDNMIGTGERSAHSNLSLVTIGIAAFFLFPILLVGVRWSEFGKKIEADGYLNVLGFLLTGIISYLYFVRALRGGSR